MPLDDGVNAKLFVFSKTRGHGDSLFPVGAADALFHVSALFHEFLRSGQRQPSFFPEADKVS
jgi:hypothetical protein